MSLVLVPSVRSVFADNNREQVGKNGDTNQATSQVNDCGNDLTNRGILRESVITSN
ncbi:MAG TPA: hypothetical protein VF220_00965 [Nitrososphaeraceae archaeon]